MNEINTSFSDIYKLNSVIKSDLRLKGKPKNLIYELYYNYLTFAISYFSETCYKDIENHTPFEQLEYEFIGDGINNSFVLDEKPPSDINFYICVDGISNGYTYLYDKFNLKITINPIPPLNSKIEIASYFIGKFNCNLNLKEKLILVEGMNVPWLEETRNRDTLLQQSVYGNDYKQYSPAEQIHQINVSIDNQYFRTVKNLINEYSYKQNPSKLMGLGGGIINGDY